MSNTAQSTSVIATTNKFAKARCRGAHKAMMNVAPTDKSSVSDHIYRTAAVVAIFACFLVLIPLVYVFVPIALGFSALVRKGLTRFGLLITRPATPTTSEQSVRPIAPAATRVLIAHDAPPSVTTTHTPVESLLDHLFDSAPVEADPFYESGEFDTFDETDEAALAAYEEYSQEEAKSTKTKAARASRHGASTTPVGRYEAKDSDKWVTGAEDATPKQRYTLGQLGIKNTSLTKAQASKLIENAHNRVAA